MNDWQVLAGNVQQVEETTGGRGEGLRIWV